MGLEDHALDASDFMLPLFSSVFPVVFGKACLDAPILSAVQGGTKATMCVNV